LAGATDPVLANAETKWAVLKAFNALIDHIANGRLKETMACFTEDADVALFGSELSDTSLGAEAIREHMTEIYARPYRVLFDLQPGKVSAHGHVAWVTAEGTLRLSTEDERRPYRLTAIMERRGDRWLWQRFEGSEPR
jgi:SnoaL-like domain